MESKAKEEFFPKIENKTKTPSKIYSLGLIFFSVIKKKLKPKSIKIPPKTMKVSFVPIEGIVKKVGMKVPNMLPKVCKAPSFPIISPLSFKVVVAYFARLGVVPPSKIRGKTKRMEQVKIDAQIKKFFPPNNITKNP